MYTLYAYIYINMVPPYDPYVPTKLVFFIGIICSVFKYI